MGLNLRAERTTPISNLIQLFLNRSENVATKIKNEDIITEQNAKLKKQLEDLFKPLALKYNIGFNICINDQSVEFSTILHLSDITKLFPIKIGIFTCNIYQWMKSTKDVEFNTLLIEKHLRILAACTRKQKTKGTISFINKNSVNVTYETRNRYF